MFEFPLYFNSPDIMFVGQDHQFVLNIAIYIVDYTLVVWCYNMNGEDKKFLNARQPSFD